jgi:flap endonuclease-1
MIAMTMIYNGQVMEGLKDNDGSSTTCLGGIFYKTVKLLKVGIKPVYVFDGIPPEEKYQELQKRKVTLRVY